MGPRVRALSVTHVRPAQLPDPPTQDADHAIKLSLFDTLFIALTPIQRLFFYEGDDLPSFPDLASTLRSSLAATLAVYTPLAGRLGVSSSADDDVAIDCSPDTVSQGVRFVEAEYAGSADDVRRLAAAAEHDAEAYAQLAPALEVSVLPSPALAVQVTRPAHGTGGAVVVGVSMNHVVADGQALWEFIRVWAAAARGSSTAGTGLVTPTFDRAAINLHPKAEEVARKFLRVFSPALPTVNTFPEPDNALQARRTYLLSGSQIRSLKHRISLHNKGADDAGTAPAAAVKPPTTTTYAAVASLVWTSGVRAKNALNHADDDAYLMFAADCRARLRPSLPGAFFGNCAKSCYARATVGGLREGGGGEALARAAAAVREAVREQLADPLADAERWLERHRALPPDRVVQIGSSNRFAAYETDFGWGRPARVELASVFVREFVAVVGAPGGAVQVSVALDRDRMDGFEANFLSLLQASA